MRRVRASSPGKVILFGEHFVVYDKPALVSAIDLRAYVEAEPQAKDVVLDGWFGENPAIRASKYVAEKLGYDGGIKLKIRSEIPESVGLGSSASVSVAAAAATSILISGELDLRLVMEAAHEGERLVHYRPSGIDTAVASLGGGGIYSRSGGFKKLSLNLDEILIVDTGKTRRTGDMVNRVKEFKTLNREAFEKILTEAEQIIYEALDALRSSNLELIGKLMLRNQELLRVVGVSSREIEDAIKLCLKAGAYGAKLTGAGGGGCVIAIADYEKMDRIRKELEKVFSAMRTKLMADGVKAEPLINTR